MIKIKGSTIKFDCIAYLDVDVPLVASLAGSTIKCIAKAKPSDLDSAKLFEITVGTGITITDSPNGAFTVSIAASNTNDLPYDIIYIETIVKLSNGDFIRSKDEIKFENNILKTLF
jgi:hypothetical protein